MSNSLMEIITPISMYCPTTYRATYSMGDLPDCQMPPIVGQIYLHHNPHLQHRDLTWFRNFATKNTWVFDE